MKKLLLVRYQEIFLKGLNRSFFENMLLKNIKRAISKYGKMKISCNQSRIFIVPQDDDYDYLSVINQLTRVFGIASVSPVYEVETNLEVIFNSSIEIMKDVSKKAKTFKVETKRAKKDFPYKSPQISSDLGAKILNNIEGLTGDVHNPDVVFNVEIRDKTYLFWEVIKGPGGLPVGTNGRATLLLSGGIDSPVAGYMIGKRGVKIDAVHFYSYPYTSERAKEKVIKLAQILKNYCIDINLYIVSFTDIQLEIRDKCPHEYLTIIMRRVMMKISEKIAEKAGSMALITGESIGQVASQTMESLFVTDNAVDMPVFRPLIGMDKYEVIDIAKKIDTFETSILPYEDCCTVFVAKHPKTKPTLSETLELEKALNIEEMVLKAVNEGTELLSL